MCLRVRVVGSVLTMVALFILLLPRMNDEERMLGADPGFVAYAARVRYRLAPGIY